MEIILTQQSELPIYEQIFTQIKAQITSGTLPAGYELPSMRKLATELQVSVITTKKAYELLGNEGYTVSRPGKGVYVQPLSEEFLKEKSQQTLRAQLRPIIQLAKTANISFETFTELTKSIYEEDLS